MYGDTHGGRITSGGSSAEQDSLSVRAVSLARPEGGGAVAIGGSSSVADEFYMGDKEALKDMLEGVAYHEEQFAFAAVSYEPPKGWKPGGWWLMLIRRDGTVELLSRSLDRRQSWKALQLTAAMVLEETWDSKKSRWIKKVSTANRRATRRPLSPRTRFDVLTRDGHRCAYCGKTATAAELHVDHRISKKDGGSDEMDNLVTACRDCNLGKSSRSVAP